MDIKDKCDRMMKIAMDIHKKLIAVLIKGIEPQLSKSHVYLLAYIRCKGGMYCNGYSKSSGNYLKCCNKSG